jgi:hypothetical protein
MNKIKVILDTQTDVREFVNIANSIDSFVHLEDGTGFRVDAKSLLGVMYGMGEFESLYVLSDYEHISTKFNKFMV